jgi:hypothetical protein
VSDISQESEKDLIGSVFKSTHADEEKIFYENGYWIYKTMFEKYLKNKKIYEFEFNKVTRWGCIFRLDVDSGYIKIRKNSNYFNADVYNDLFVIVEKPKMIEYTGMCD